MKGKVSGISFTPIEDHHPVEWLRGKVILEIACDVEDLRGGRLGEEVEVQFVNRRETFEQ